MIRNLLVAIVIETSMSVSFSATAQMPAAGKILFIEHCVKCHGEDGTRGRWGANNLQITKLADQGLQSVISNGRGIMPRWSKKLDQNQISQLVNYIRTLRH